jgi:hypothetical protein
LRAASVSLKGLNSRLCLGGVSTTSWICPGTLACRHHTFTVCNHIVSFNPNLVTSAILSFEHMKAERLNLWILLPKSVANLPCCYCFGVLHCASGLFLPLFVALWFCSSIEIPECRLHTASFRLNVQTQHTNWSS